jgi:hypothetical protein
LLDLFKKRAQGAIWSDSFTSVTNGKYSAWLWEGQASFARALQADANARQTPALSFPAQKQTGPRDIREPVMCDQVDSGRYALDPL